MWESLTIAFEILGIDFPFSLTFARWFRELCCVIYKIDPAHRKRFSGNQLHVKNVLHEVKREDTVVLLYIRAI